jgi:hypothetical protein
LPAHSSMNLPENYGLMRREFANGIKCPN